MISLIVLATGGRNSKIKFLKFPSGLEHSNGIAFGRKSVVLTVIGYRDEQEAAALANDSGYGLAGSVWTADTDRGLAIAAQIKTGTFGVNQGYTMDPSHRSVASRTVGTAASSAARVWKATSIPNQSPSRQECDRLSTLSFDGRVVVVTGAGGGLGRCHALEFARRGAHVVVNDVGAAVDGTGPATSAAQAVVDEITAAGGSAVANTDSVATDEGGKGITPPATEAFGRVDVLINNAGILRDAAFKNMTADPGGCRSRCAPAGAFNVTRAVWPVFREQDYGRIVMDDVGLRPVRHLRAVELRRGQDRSGQADERAGDRGDSATTFGSTPSPPSPRRG